jgi:hypothetical protein
MGGIWYTQSFSTSTELARGLSYVPVGMWYALTRLSVFTHRAGRATRFPRRVNESYGLNLLCTSGTRKRAIADYKRQKLLRKLSMSNPDISVRCFVNSKR